MTVVHNLHKIFELHYFKYIMQVVHGSDKLWKSSGCMSGSMVNR